MPFRMKNVLCILCYKVCTSWTPFVIDAFNIWYWLYWNPKMRKWSTLEKKNENSYFGNVWGLLVGRGGPFLHQRIWTEVNCKRNLVALIPSLIFVVHFIPQLYCSLFLSLSFKNLKFRALMLCLLEISRNITHKKWIVNSGFLQTDSSQRPTFANWLKKYCTISIYAPLGDSVGAQQTKCRWLISGLRHRRMTRLALLSTGIALFCHVTHLQGLTISKCCKEQMMFDAGLDCVDMTKTPPNEFQWFPFASVIDLANVARKNSMREELVRMLRNATVLPGSQPECSDSEKDATYFNLTKPLFNLLLLRGNEMRVHMSAEKTLHNLSLADSFADFSSPGNFASGGPCRNNFLLLADI